jgi:REP element-mobilizing transposase RayT
MVAGYHLIWTAYGWWLPNDPRGSTSREIRQAHLASLGALHHGRKRIQPAGRTIQAFYDAARGRLKHALVKLSARDVPLVADALADVIRQQAYTCYACAIMPDHVHLLIRKHKHRAEQMIENFQEASRLRLREAGLRAADHPVWGGPGWKVYQDSREDMERTIRYIRDNPGHLGMAEQHWSFVRAYDGWLPGQVRVVRPRNRKRQSGA